MTQDCWVGRSEGCTKPREWAVFHERIAFEEPFDVRNSVYLGVCSDHLLPALRRDPLAVNYVRPLTEGTQTLADVRESTSKVRRRS